MSTELAELSSNRLLGHILHLLRTNEHMCFLKHKEYIMKTKTKVDKDRCGFNPSSHIVLQALADTQRLEIHTETRHSPSGGFLLV